jgi:hypothetical protein
LLHGVASEEVSTRLSENCLRDRPPILTLAQKEQREKDPGRVQVFGPPKDHEIKIMEKLEEVAKRKGTLMTSVALA